jgi:hypothetical protein
MECQDPYQQTADTFDRIAPHWLRRTARKMSIKIADYHNKTTNKWKIKKNNRSPGQTCDKGEVPSTWDLMDSMLRG